MKRTSIVLIGQLLTGFGWIATVAAEPPDAAEEVRALHARYDSAVQTMDADAIDPLLADDFVVVNDKGMAAPKAMVLAAWRSGAVKFTSYKTDDIQVRVYGDSAVVTGKMESKGTRMGQEFQGTSRFIRVFVKRDGTWKAVHSQVTPIAASQ